MGLGEFLGKFFGKKSDRDIRDILPLVESTKAIYETLSGISGDELRARSQRLRTSIQTSVAEEKQQIVDLKQAIEADDPDYEEREELYRRIDKIQENIDKKYEAALLAALPEAFALVRETARRFKEDGSITVTANDFDRDLAARKDNVTIDGDKALYSGQWMAGGNMITWDMVHYEVQLIGGIVLHEGKIAEMATGEGKTLVATLPVFLNALTGRGVHIVTVNDYLARRDSEWMGPIYEFHGLSVDCIDRHQPNSDARRKAYNADITFGTNNEFGFDYLRDNMAVSPDDLVQREHIYAIVDEVDSVLIDDARTPLIISGPVPKGENQLFDELKEKVYKLVTAQRRLVTQLLADSKRLLSSDRKEEKEQGAIMLLRSFKGLPRNKALIKFLSEEGMKALMHKTEDVYLADNAKRMPEVTSELYFVIDEKNHSVELTDKGIDLISDDTSDPTFFVLPDIGSELADIERSPVPPAEKTAKKEKLLEDYAVKSERVHTINQLLKAYALFERDVEYVVMDNKVKIVDEQTGRILEGRRYSDGLHQAIEAKENVKIEAATQTFATVTLQNYFRMYKKLAGMTGTAETEAGELWDIYKLDVVVIPTNRPIVRDDREDLVYKTAREKYTAVIEEIVDLVGKGRPVLVGTTSVEVSELLSRMLKMRGMSHNVLNAKLHQREADIVAEAGKPGTITIATNMAGRGTDIKIPEAVRQAGGLAIIGTERHESRRVDRQLRGRAGRQGDPGSSQFFVSLEDNLMRLFGSDRIARLMDTLGLKEGEVIQHRMITKSIERAQKKVEENNFGIRKRLLEYDDVMNNQRTSIYGKRRHALYGEKMGIEVANMQLNVAESLVDEFHSASDYQGFSLALIKYFGIESPVDEKQFLKLNAEEVVHEVFEVVKANYRKKAEEITRLMAPVIADFYKHHAHQVDVVGMPFSDGNHLYRIPVNLQKAFESNGKEVVRAFEKTMMLHQIDELWKEHLREMDDLRQSVQNATYEQKDPLLIYKFESFNLFTAMIDRLNKLIVPTLMRGKPAQIDPSQVQQAQAPRREDYSRYRTSKSEFGSSFSRPPQQGDSEPAETRQKVQTVVRTEKKVGRNDPCPCGSGKKYKQCHGKDEA